MEQGKPLANSMGEVRGLIARCKDYAKTAELKDEIVSEDDDAQYLLRSIYTSPSPLAGWLAGWLSGWLAGWLSGWLGGWLPPALPPSPLLCVCARASVTLLLPKTGTGLCTHHVVSLAGLRRGIFRSVL
eukprot:COSAG03_NODE_1895_length_3382_cov_7.437709_4_plen_129_part_00